MQYPIRHSYKKKSHSNLIFPAENDTFDIINLLFLNTILSPLQNSVLTCFSGRQGKVLKLLKELTYLLTPWCRVLLEKLTGLQLVKKFPAFYGT